MHPTRFSLGAAALPNAPATVGVQARMLIQKQSLSAGPQTYREYGDSASLA
jgi:hypothetical protein